MCSLLPNNFQQSVSWLRSGTWAESSSTGTHSKSAQTQETHRASQLSIFTWPEAEQVLPATSSAVHKMLFSCTWVMPKLSDGVHMLPGTKQELLPSPVLVSKKIESGTAHSVLKSLTSCRWAVVTCSVHVCSVIGTMWTIHNLEKHHLTWIQVWGLVYSEASKYRSAVDRGFRMLIYNRERAAAVRSSNLAQSQINIFQRAVLCHADKASSGHQPAHPE